MVTIKEIAAAAKIICTHAYGDRCVMVHDPERKRCNQNNCRLWGVVRKALKAAHMTKPATKVTRARMAGPDHAVLTVVTTGRKAAAFRREPCEECPWRKGRVGSFPAEAFRHSAPTAYDAALSTFACHMSGARAPLTCAGFLLSDGAPHNIAVRMAAANKGLRRELISSTVPLFPHYRAMAIANGVAADDPALAPCRDRTTEDRQEK